MINIFNMFLFIGIVIIYSLLGVLVCIMDALTYGRLWPRLPIYFIFIFWPIFLIYEVIKNWIISLKR